jgi:FMN phosphatase YigB (HAD superfamily)
MLHFVFDLDDTIVVHRNDTHYKLARENKELTYYLDKCSGPKYIYTNGTWGHAKNLLVRLNVMDKFVKIFARDTLPEMKPHFESGFMVHKNIMRERFETGASFCEIQKDKYIFFDDVLVNHAMAKNLGWITVWIHPHHEAAYQNQYVDFAYPNLIEALKDIETII